MEFIDNSCQPFTKITCLVDIDLFHLLRTKTITISFASGCLRALAIYAVSPLERNLCRSLEGRFCHPFMSISICAPDRKKEFGSFLTILSLYFEHL
jgi:hypothetical protein